MDFYIEIGIMIFCIIVIIDSIISLATLGIGEPEYMKFVYGLYLGGGIIVFIIIALIFINQFKHFFK